MDDKITIKDKEVSIFFILALIGVLVVACFFNNCSVYADDKKPEYKPFECPKTHISDQDKCFQCHITPTFAIREQDPHAFYNYPNLSTKILEDRQGKYGYYKLSDIADDQVKDMFDYMYRHKINRVVMEMHSPGGSLMNAWRIKGIMDEWRSRGVHIETRLYGMAASAGFLLFCAGTERVVNETAEGMWHELITGEFMAIKSPADKEDEALVLRHLQNTANDWIASRSKIKKDVLDEKIRKKEFWVNGKEMIEMGFADKSIGTN